MVFQVTLLAEGCRALVAGELFLGAILRGLLLLLLLLLLLWRSYTCNLKMGLVELVPYGSGPEYMCWVTLRWGMLDPHFLRSQSSSAANLWPKWTLLRCSSRSVSLCDMKGHWSHRNWETTMLGKLVLAPACTMGVRRGNRAARGRL